MFSAVARFLRNRDSPEFRRNSATTWCRLSETAMKRGRPLRGLDRLEDDAGRITRCHAVEHAWAAKRRGHIHGDAVLQLSSGHVDVNHSGSAGAAVERD